jgi:hypothetical protein
MPVRARVNRRRKSEHIAPEAVDIFRKGVLASGYALRELKIALAAALGRSKFAANPLDCEPRSLIACDVEPAEVAIEIRRQLLKKTRRNAALKY